VYHRVDLQPADQLSNRSVPDVRMDEVHLLQSTDRVVNVTTEQGWNMRGEPPRHFGAEWIGNAGDQDPLGLE
jgi:hypothetical protein